MGDLEPAEALQRIIEMLTQTRSNRELLNSIVVGK